MTWCHRVLQPDEPSLKPAERMLLDKICDAYYLPAWCSVADYEKLFGKRARSRLGPAYACVCVRVWGGWLGGLWV